MHPFDLQHTLLAKHAQHIVLVHFPIALVCVALLFDLLGLRWRDRGFAAAAYYNLSIAAAAVFPVVITGLLAWHRALEGAAFRGILRLHVLLGATSALLICVTWLISRKTRGTNSALRIAMEFAAIAFVVVTAHLGGVVSGVVN